MSRPPYTSLDVLCDLWPDWPRVRAILAKLPALYVESLHEQARRRALFGTQTPALAGVLREIDRAWNRNVEAE